MRALSAQDVLRVWEAAAGRPSVEKALAMLAAACPERSQEELAALPVGARDACLLRLRERIFGGKLDGLVQCPRCGEHLEVSLATEELLTATEPQEGPIELELSDAGLRLKFRLADSEDLAVAATFGNREAGRRVLLERCLIEASRTGAALAASDLPEEAITALAARMAECDPQADVELELNCTACGHRWQVGFDIVSFLWTELAAQARRLLREVHVLARAYGWREADILAMSAQRRQFYLDMVS